MSAPPPSAAKWSDNVFLDRMRDASDPLADACARDLSPDESMAFLFAKMRTGADLPVETEYPPAFVAFLKSAAPSLDLSDLSEEELAKLARGQHVFLRAALPSVVVLLHKSLQEGYQAPRLGKVLMLSGALDHQTYRRLLGVLQMLLRVVQPGSFEPKLVSDLLPASDAALEAVKVRLMHAGIRGIARGRFPDFAATHGGMPISLEDMLATLIAFSTLVLDGLEVLGIRLSDEDAEAYHFVWRVYARLMGIHPPGQQKSWDWIPQSVADAGAFYAQYRKRHYVTAEQNPTGVALAAAGLKMLSLRLPLFVPRIYMRTLMGREASDALGIRPLPLMFLWKAFWLHLPRIWFAIWRQLDKRPGAGARHDALTMFVLQKLIVLEYRDGTPTYVVPRQASDIREVVRGTNPGLAYGSDQFRREVFPVELRTLAERRSAIGAEPGAGWANGPPRADRGLVGLALSGGGIRSATFGLGAVQAIARNRRLEAVDYLSTVSGGGYTGSALSSMLNDPDAAAEGKSFPINFEPGSVELPAMRHIRSGSNYLTGGGTMDVARLPAILLRGLLLNVLLIVPWIMVLATVTMLVYPFVYEMGLIQWAFWLALLTLLTFVASYPLMTRWFRHRLTWPWRNRSENALATALVAFGVTLAVSLASGLITDAIGSNWAGVRSVVLGELRSPAEPEDIWKWAIVALVVLGVLRAGKLSESAHKWSSQIFLYAVGLSAPVVVFGVYLMFLVLFARSPYLHIDKNRALTRAAAASPPVIGNDSLLHALQASGLNIDETSRVVVDSFHRGTPTQWTIRAGHLHHYRITEVNSTLRMGGVDFGRGVSRIEGMAPASVKQENLSERLLAQLDSLASLPPAQARMRDTVMLNRLNRLGVRVSSSDQVIRDSSTSRADSTRGETPGGGTRGLAGGAAGGTASASWKMGEFHIDYTRRGMIIRDAMLGPVDSLGSFARGASGPLMVARTIATSSAYGQILRAMERRGAMLDGSLSVFHYHRDTSWLVHSGEVTDYVVRRMGALPWQSVEDEDVPAATGWAAFFRSLISPGSRVEYLHIADVEFGSRRADWVFGLAGLALLIFGLWFLDVNVTSPHSYWRDRLSRVFLIRSRWFGRPVPNDAQKLSDLGTLNAAVPYHIVNTALNLSSSRVEDLPGRGCDFFMFTKHYVGGFATGYCRTTEMERADNHIDLGTAMAISSAAVAPNAGTATVKPLSPVLTLLNVRQGYWAPNPWFVQAPSLLRQAITRTVRPGPWYLFREALGLVDARGWFVNLSDGGHIENLGIYELLRRRCKVVVAVDAEHDPTMAFRSLATVMRFARIDLGIDIEIDLSPLALDANGRCRRHWTVGKIRYNDAESGYLLYVKSSMTGDEVQYIKDYRAAHPDFPQESTADQFFGEDQFESYRALGFDAMDDALSAVAAAPAPAAAAAAAGIGPDGALSAETLGWLAEIESTMRVVRDARSPEALR